MSDEVHAIFSQRIVGMDDARPHLRRETPLSGGGGGGTFDPMEARVAALEAGMDEIKAVLKEIRDSQQSAAVTAAEQRGDLNTRFAELGTRFAEVNTHFAQVAGQLRGINEVDTGLRREIDRLPSKWDVATIMFAVIGGLVGVATLLKFVWPSLSKLFT